MIIVITRQLKKKLKQQAIRF